MKSIFGYLRFFVYFFREISPYNFGALLLLFNFAASMPMTDTDKNAEQKERNKRPIIFYIATTSAPMHSLNGEKQKTEKKKQQKPQSTYETEPPRLDSLCMYIFPTYEMDFMCVFCNLNKNFDVFVAYHYAQPWHANTQITVNQQNRTDFDVQTVYVIFLLDDVGLACLLSFRFCHSAVHIGSSKRDRTTEWHSVGGKFKQNNTDIGSSCVFLTNWFISHCFQFLLMCWKQVLHENWRCSYWYVCILLR